MELFKGKLGKKIKRDLSAYFDESIPDWLKTKRALRKEVGGNLSKL